MVGSPRARSRCPFLAAVLVLVACSETRTVDVPPVTAAPPALSVTVEGNQLLDGDRRPLRLLGVNRSGTEYACAERWGVFDGPSDRGSIAAMASWRINAVRLPLNEGCWRGHPSLVAAHAGANYRKAVGDYVQALHRAGLIVVLDLHWSAPGEELPAKSPRMPNADHSADFWRSVASQFKPDPAVVFDLFNEPREVDWDCWQHGCVTEFGWRAAGMQSLVDAVRSTGAQQPVLVPGLDFANDLSEWLARQPQDPRHQIAAAFHLYDDNPCSHRACWDAEVAPVAARVPVVTTELGETDCAHGFIDSFMNWADANGLSYLGWSWNPTDCRRQPALISSYDGTPTPYGVGLRDHLMSLSRRPVPSSSVP